MPLYLPELNKEESSRSMTATFLGLNRNLRIADGEWYDMQNLTSDHAPVMEVRKRRGLLTTPRGTRPSSITTRAVGEAGTFMPVWLEGTKLYEGKYAQPIDLSDYGVIDDGTERQMVNMGAYLIIAPDMVYINTVEGKEADRGRISDRFESKGATWKVTVADYEGNAPEYTQAVKPEAEEEEEIPNGALWHKTGERPELMRYDKALGEWYKVTSYLKIEGKRVQEEVETYVPISLKSAILVGDTVRISGIHASVNDTSMIIKTDENKQMDQPATYIMVEGIIGKREETSTEDVVIERVIPKMDFICEANNRLWGCRYGDDGNGNFVNEIYCSARGDFYRWIAGSSDNDDAPVTFSTGADGAWTGAINYDGHPTFFKERTMYRISGYGASNFSVYDMQCMGVARGAHKSMAVVKNVLYYKAASAVMAFDGSLPVPVSGALGRLHGYTGAVGGACGAKYYLNLYKKGIDGSVTDKNLYVLDTDKGVWHREDDIECESMAAAGDNMYFIEVIREPDIKHSIKTVEPTLEMTDADTESTRMMWYAETGLIGLESPDAKYLTKIAIRLKLEAGATVRISVQYDSMGEWKQVMAVEPPYMKTAMFPVQPRRHDHVRLRLDGVGGCQVFSITRTFENAEDM